MQGYLSGFGNTFSSEAIPLALPREQNNPQKVPMGLYAEQLSGTAFTVDRKHNQYTWFYRLLPSVVQGDFTAYTHATWLAPPFNNPTSPQQLRWSPLPFPTQPTDFIDSLVTFVGHGGPASRSGAAISLYAATADMSSRYFYNADAEMLFIPQQNALRIFTECGVIDVAPGEIAMLPRGMKCQISLPNGNARGYVCENFGNAFALPDLGLMGPNALAQPRHFLTPQAAFEDQSGDYTLLTRFQGQLWQAKLTHSPLNVVAWHGNYVPYKYDLKLYTTVYSVSHDHIDPSIFTVLSSLSSHAGVSNLDFVIFPARWMVMEHTLRIPYYHRNTMSEYMGLIYGEYDAKKDGFTPGGGSLHNCMSAHGPDAVSYQKATQANLVPEYYQNTLAFMLESFLPWQVSKFASQTELRQKDYLDCWRNLPKTFKR